MTDLLTHFSTEIARKLASDQDALIRDCAAERLGCVLPDAELIPRMRIEQQRGHPEKMFLLDDKPLLLIWPAKSEMIEDRGRSMMNWKVQYQKMYPGGQAPSEACL